MRKNFILTVTKKDKRFNSGSRVCGTYTYTGVDPKWMSEETAEIRRLYSSADGYTVDVVETK